ncbi:MAG: N-acetyltransferase, partial [Flavisolibacter sp.]|nr:N-acetyltransferase [Flavisolibacter sp.]
AVVTRPVVAYALVVGNPARHIGWMSAYGQRLHFDAAGRATCSESGEEYLLNNNQVQKIKRG